MAIIKKTTVVAKPATKPAAKAAAKPVVKATMTKVMVDKKTGKATKSAPVAMKSKSITAKEFNTDKKVSKVKPYDNSKYLADSAARAPMVKKRAEAWTRDSTKMENSVKTIDSINKANKGSLLMGLEDAKTYQTAEDSFYSAAGRVSKQMKNDVAELKKVFTYTPDKKPRKKK